MSFQTTVGFRNTSGFLGQIIREVPSIVKVWRLSSQTAVVNTFGKAFTASPEVVTTPEMGLQAIKVAAVGGTAAFAGILVNPSEFANSGSAAGTLAPNLNLPAYSRAELMTEGEAVVSFATAVAYGDGVAFDPATGALVAPGAGMTTIVGAMVTNATTAAGLTTISLAKLPTPASA